MFINGVRNNQMILLILLETETEDSFYLIIINKDANFLGAIQ